MNEEGELLRFEIIEALKSQGFVINPNLGTEINEKNRIRKLHEYKRNEVLKKHSNFLDRNLEKIKEYSIDGSELEPEKIDLELIEVKPKSLESKIFLFWNLIWWSLPYTHPYGRQLRFILWDKCHNAPFGLILLQSPPLNSKVRDTFLGLTSKNVDYWINQSMYAQRLGALPPYNELLGGKMIALSLTSNEIRESYENKYKNRETLLRKRILPSRLLFVTTTSAYGKSSVYERIKYGGDKVSQFMGFTAGSGTFHIPNRLYEKLLSFLEKKGYNVERGFGTGVSRKLRLINLALRKLDLKHFSFHNIKRGYYLFSNVRNLESVIHNNEMAQWHYRPFDELAIFWMKRWCLPRSLRVMKWRRFNVEKYFDNVQKYMNQLNACAS